MVELRNDYAMLRSLQITKESIYCFTLPDKSLAYVEVDMKNGAVTTCVPFAKKAKKERKNLYYGNFTICDNGKGISEHNCS